VPHLQQIFSKPSPSGCNTDRIAWSAQGCSPRSTPSVSMKPNSYSHILAQPRSASEAHSSKEWNINRAILRS